MKKTLLSIILLVVVHLTATGSKANITIVQPAGANHVHTVSQDDDTSTLVPDPVIYLPGATNAMKGALAADFPAWKFNFAAGLNGILTINRYQAELPADEVGGALFDATYARAAGDPAIADLHWIQMIDTNRPLNGPGNPYIDPRPNDDTLPFYWTLAEDQNPADGNKTAATYHFFDEPSRNNLDNAVTWRGELMLASWDGRDPGNVTVYDGVRWGFDAISVPEPSSLTLVVTSVAICGWRLRRRTLRSHP